MYQAGDIGFSRPCNPDFMAKAIMWSQEHRGEAPALCSHAFHFIAPVSLLEALFKGLRITSFEARYELSDKYEYAVYRRKDITLEQRKLASTLAEKWRGRAYGYLKLPLHLADGLLSKISGGDVWFFRHLGRFSSRYKICSWCVAVFGVHCGWWGSKWGKMANPDDLLDHVMLDGEFECVFHTDRFFRTE